MPPPREPTLLEIDARVWLRERPWHADRIARGLPPDLSAIPDDTLDDWASLGLDWIWFMGVWESSPVGRAIASSREDLWREYRAALPDARPEDVVGSPYCIRDYRLDPALGDESTLPRLRDRLRERGMRLMLDFVPNHLAHDHDWTSTHPERFLRGTDDELARAPDDFRRTPAGHVLACARDPYFPPWTDVAQLDWFSPSTIEAMEGELLRVASCCDGVRCDMAMLVLGDVFARTWGDRALGRAGREAPPKVEFWERAIARVRASHPGFAFLAEVYWDLEARLQSLGFDWTYDKRLYDRMRNHPERVAEHLVTDSPPALDFQRRCARFAENHDEPRAATAFGPRTRAAVALCGVVPGLAFHQEGQWEGRRVRTPVQLARRRAESPDAALAEWHRALLRELKRSPWRDGAFRRLEVGPASPGDASHEGLVAVWRESPATDAVGEPARALAVFNLRNDSARGRVAIPEEVARSSRGRSAGARSVLLHDAVAGVEYERSLEELLRPAPDGGLYVALGTGEVHLFRWTSS